MIRCLFWASLTLAFFSFRLWCMGASSLACDLPASSTCGGSRVFYHVGERMPGAAVFLCVDGYSFFYSRKQAVRMSRVLRRRRPNSVFKILVTRGWP